MSRIVTPPSVHTPPAGIAVFGALRLLLGGCHATEAPTSAFIGQPEVIDPKPVRPVQPRLLGQEVRPEGLQRGS